MDNIRLILFFSLAFILLMLWQAWNEDYGPKPIPAETVSTTANGETPSPSAVPQAPAESAVPSAEVPSGAVPTAPEMTSAGSAGQKIAVMTDLYNMEIDTRGGNVLKVFLNDYPETLKNPEQKFQLLRSQTPNLLIAQSGLISNDKENAPTHEAVYSVEQTSYTMAEGSNTLEVNLFWTNDKGVKVTKRFSFQRGSYQVKVQHIVENGSGETWNGREYRQLVRSEPVDTSADSKLLYTYTGAAIYSPEEKFEKITFEDMEDSKLDRDVKGGWISMLQHYFMAAWVPKPEETDKFYTNVLSNGRYIVGAYSPPMSVAAGSQDTFTTSFVAAPKLQDKLAEIAPGLDLTVDYGWLTVLAQPIFWLMNKIHSVVGNWGWSIIILTLLIKLAFYKLSETSYKSMANMRKMTPRIQALKDRYGDDKQRLNQAMMEMYKTEKVNPLSGCLPILVQIPVFIALYWVLLESVEMRQAPFMLWIQDLSVKDPYFVLPVIMGVSMFIQQKLNPAPPDPMQAKIMMSLPFVFTVFFAFFPAGLVLYWVVNNILSITQQWYITRQIEQASK
ncbi:MAG: membrane protein insertase YidC [Chromatiales bacterium]|nr:membrane protein insertase YidC [Chromatiales bacterium]